MHFEKINNTGQAQLFKNSFLESLTKTRPWIIYSIYIPLCAFLLFYSYSELGFSAAFISGLFFISMLSWTLCEYIAHRYLFHYEATSKLGLRIVYIFHGNHHEYPRDKQRLFMPPVPSMIAAFLLFSLFFGLSYLLTGTGNYAFICFPGFVTGYLIYVSRHYAIHAFPPPNLHHYKYPEKGFGVSSVIWDVVFRTIPKKDGSENQQTK
ncbi:sterol desaturase family protein [Rubrolithibacter danxiaensis]|uniref:sterol desaturase family protein n=1 Tax=Rubrolithibacter danxiaensis TaxID=3390805 RepID=UPI003BF7E193